MGWSVVPPCSRGMPESGERPTTSAGVMAPLVAEEGDELGGEEGEVNVSLEDFTVHGLVGEGEFGKVSAGLGRGPGRGTRPRPGSGLRRRVGPCSARPR